MDRSNYLEHPRESLGESPAELPIQTNGGQRGKIRKVQWAAGPSDESPVHEETLEGLHMLDEKGQDPERFQQLADALEEHRRSAPLQRVRYYSPEEPPTADDTSTPSKDLYNGPEHSGESSEETPTHSSAGHRARTPRKVQWPDEPTEESKIHEEQLLEGAHMLDEKGQDPERFQKLTEALEEHRRTRPLQRVYYYPPEGPTQHIAHDTSTLSRDTPDSIYPASPSGAATFTPAEPSHRVPDNFIGEHEDAGLPGTKDLRDYAIEKAESVVQGHLKRASDIATRHDKRRKERLQKGNPEKAVERERDVENGEMNQPEGGGILSALLNLYRNYEDTPSTLSIMSSRRSSFDEYNTPLEREAPHTQLSNKLDKRNDRRERVYNRRRWHCKIPDMFGHISRPAAAKSAGGVFGPLIASTGNLAGIAAPVASQLQPNLKRPGYSLSRYSMETVDMSQSRARPPLIQRRHTSDYAGGAYAPKREPETPGATPLTSPSGTSNGTRPFYHQGAKSNLSSLFGDYVHSIRSGGWRSGCSSPTNRSPTSTGAPRPRRKRKKAEVYITRHVAQIIRREEFVMKLTRAMMMFGAPSHRLQSQIQSAARVLDLKLSFLYLPDIVLLSFDDNSTGTSHLKLIRQSSALDIGKLNDGFILYWKVIHDQLLVSDASAELDALMKKKPLYNWLTDILIGGMCSASICTVSFGGSFIDAVVSFPFGALLVGIQLLSVRNVLYSHVFEVTITTLFSFLAAALATTHKLCYPAVTSSSVVLILPGFLVLTGSLELMSRHIISGSVRLLFSVVYALFLGFGFVIGAELFEIFTGHLVYGAEDYTCSMTHSPDGAWYQRTPSTWWAFLTVPMFSMFLSLRNRTPWNKKELLLLVIIASVGWVTNHFAGKKFVGQSDINAAVGAFAVGLISNLYSRIFSGNAFVVMITGILFQLPSGLGSGGLLSYASQHASDISNAYLSGFQTALKLVSVAIGITIGLGLSLVLTHPVQSRKREAGIFSL